MKSSLTEILEIKAHDYRPSVEFARQILSEVIPNENFSIKGPPSILDKYFDNGYTATFEDIQLWLEKRADLLTEELRSVVSENIPEPCDKDWPVATKVERSLDRYSHGEIDLEGLVLEVAELWAWMDTSPFWCGSAADKHWHLARIQSAILRVSEANVTAIDALHDLAQVIIEAQINFAERMLEGEIKGGDLADLAEVASKCLSKAQIVREAEEQILSYGIKLSFLFRDAWWIESHGDITIRGYLGKQHQKKRERAAHCTPLANVDSAFSTF